MCLLLFLNIILYGASAFLILFPLVIKKDYTDNFEQKKFLHNFYLFGGLIFILNTFFIYIMISSLLLQNTYDANNYIIDVKDISEQNKGKNNDKHYNSLYKFYRYFYQTQIRFLVQKKHKNIFISKGYGYFNKELKEIIINNNIECEKELEEDNRSGSDVLKLRSNRNKKKTISEKDEINNNNSEKSSMTSNNKSNEQKDNNNNEKLIYNEEKKSMDKKSNSKKSICQSISSQNQKKKKIIIETINTDIPEKEKEKEKEKSSKREEIKNQENISIKSKSSKKSKKSERSNSKINKNKNKESLISKNKNDNFNNNKKFEESKEFFENENKEDNNKHEKESIKNKLIDDNNIFNDNFDLLVSTPIHNNGK